MHTKMPYCKMKHTPINNSILNSIFETKEETIVWTWYFKLSPLLSQILSLRWNCLLEYVSFGAVGSFSNVQVSNVAVFRWGAPTRLLSDQGREFVAKVNDEMCRKFGIKRSVTSAYHPQTNGLDERTNQTLKQHLSKLVNEEQSNWSDFLDEVAYSIRTQKQKRSTHHFSWCLAEIQICQRW